MLGTELLFRVKGRAVARTAFTDSLVHDSINENLNLSRYLQKQLPFSGFTRYSRVEKESAGRKELSKHGVSPGEAPIPNVVGISVLCMLALLPDPSSLLSDHVDAALRESAKGDYSTIATKLFRSGIAFLIYFLSRPEPELTHLSFGLVQFGVAPSENIKEFSE
ncbi:hypothetical protein VNO77_50924 [Canavalia gladiata]|uniref:Uncharacterized protein n=1 Tax=Canavalia gladiata TaxID=3824 RepID=A0AAN9PEV0_CANGL